MTANMISSIVTIISVLIGAALGWGATYYFEAKKRGGERLATAYSLLFKVQSLTNEIVQLKKNVDENYTDAARQGHEGPAWTKLSTVVGFDAEVVLISAEEMALVAMTKDVELLMDIRELESGHRILKAIINEMQRLRANMESMNLAQQVQDRSVTFAVTEEMYPQVAPTIIGLNDLSQYLDVMLPRIEAQARKTSSRLGPHLKKEYKFKHFLALSLPGGEAGGGT